MLKDMKSLIRHLTPIRYQVPIKYIYNYICGFLEPEMDLLNHLIQPGDRVVDVGANRGIYVYKLWRLGAQVEAFEPNPVCHRVLSAWAKGRAGVKVHTIALSDKDGAGTLHIPLDASGAEHDASASIEACGLRDTRKQPVLMATLDSFGFCDIALIKIDVEGHEQRVIAGGVDTLRATKPVLIVEIEYRHNGCPVMSTANMIMNYGYRGYFIFESKFYSILEFNPETHQNDSNIFEKSNKYINNFIFLHKDLLAEGKYRSLPGLEVAK